jgi:hypothetical protein
MCDYARFIPPRSEGRTRRHGRRAGCDGRGLHHLTRDASGGRQRRVVLIPRRWNQVCRRYARQATVAIKPGHRGERAISRKTIAQGRPECFGVPVFTRVLSTFYLAHEAAGAACIRLSLRPLFSRVELTQDSGVPCRENAVGCLVVIARSVSSEAIHTSACGAMDCFAALAMTTGRAGHTGTSRIPPYAHRP